MKIWKLPLYILTQKSVDTIIDEAGTTARQIETTSFAQLLHENRTMREIISGNEKMRKLLDMSRRKKRRGIKPLPKRR